MPKHSYLFAVISLSLVTVSCNKRLESALNQNTKLEAPQPPEGDTPDLDPPNTPPSDDNTDNKLEPEFFACYPGGPKELCYPTSDINQAQDETGEYGYANPYRDSFPASFDPKNYEAPFRILEINTNYNSHLLTNNFSYNELVQKRKGDFGLISRFALLKMQALREDLKTAIHPTSVFRSPAYNSSVGGATWSRHMYGDAFDFYAPESSLQSLKRLCERHGASFVQLYRSHIHCDWRDLRKDPSFYHTDDDEEMRPQQVAHRHSEREDQLSEEIQINQSLIATGGLRMLSLDIPFKEDGGDLDIQWKVKGKGFNQTFNDPLIELPSGIYQMDILIGGTVRKKLKYRVE